MKDYHEKAENISVCGGLIIVLGFIASVVLAVASEGSMVFYAIGTFVGCLGIGMLFFALEDILDCANDMLQELRKINGAEDKEKEDDDNFVPANVIPAEIVKPKRKKKVRKADILVLSIAGIIILTGIVVLVWVLV